MKKIVIKYTYLVIIALFALMLSSCTKLEDTSYTDIVASKYVPSKDDIGSLVGPAYAGWRSVLFTGAQGFFLNQEISADGLAVPAKPYGFVDGGTHRRMHEHTWTSEQAHMQSLWTTAYSGITNCNRIIYQIESGIIPVAENDYKSVLGELKTLRASYYYVLCDGFGNVPIVTTFDVPEGFLPTQSTRKEVYDFIVSEITESIPHLSNDFNGTTYARFKNKWSAYALLAKMYLNAKIYSGTEAWTNCISACDAIINSGLYQLETTQKDCFIQQNQNSKEIIWSIAFDDVYAGSFSLAAWTMLPQNQFTYNTKYGGWGGLNAIPQFINTYNPNDLRLTKGWMMGQQYASDGTPLKCSYGVMVGKPLVYVNEIPGIDSTQEVHSFRVEKFEIANGSYAHSMSNDFPLFRYADVLMMKAECLLRTGKADQAAQLVTQVRLRSFPGHAELATVTGAQLQQGSSYDYGLRNYHKTTNEGGSDIQFGRFLDELGWEFAAEAHRRQDMIRFGIYTTKSWLSHSPSGNSRILFPIPLAELNKNTNLKQNPGYN